MNKFYALIIFIGITFSSQAQQNGRSDVNNTLETQLKVLRFYPNPAVSVINFEFLKPVQKDLTLQVFNFIGKKVYELTNVSQKATIALNEFSRGIYIFQLRDKTGQIVESGKFQVVK